MTPGELAKLAEWAEDRWPGTRAFRNIDRTASDFGGLPAKAVWEAARNHYNAGNRTAPTLSELKAEAARIARGQGLTDPQQAACDTRGRHGAFAIDDIGTKDGEPWREATCVDCGTTVRKPARHLLTEGEKTDLEARGEAPADPIADRIAP